jgi:Protein of unknown function (DUF1553)/Protein of unknown function (DUF1549)/Concanavalin A-like lectin/glucanases superfamily/Planctomycete cytochrome C
MPNGFCCGLRLALLATVACLSVVCWAAEPDSDAVLFNRDIRPIISDHCYTCHGPDKANRKTNMHFDTEEGAFAALNGGGFAIVRADPANSKMVQRISSDNPPFRMPPAYMGYAKLPDRDIDLIRRWIAQGAKWQKHWSFIPPEIAPQPQVMHKDWPRNAIDYYVLAHLEHEGLAPSPEADPATLIRRVTLDLTGLPPTPAEVDTFLNDHSPSAYEKVVDRLLNSPRYGENMAWMWLDAARYADTNGYQSDGVRNMWRWRDWVIDAYNRNMPFNQFTVQQLAGDMLPHATRDQIIATGFNRNHRTSAEGGIIDEEFRVAYVVDRVDTTSSVWLGLTVGCARCHDHKFDPILQKEYYQLFAYFNNVPEKGFVYNWGNEEPYVKAPTPVQEAKLKALDSKLAAKQAFYTSLQPEITKSQRAWERWVKSSHIPDWNVSDGLILHFPLDGDLRETTGVYDRRNSFNHQPPGGASVAKSDDPLRPVVAGGTNANLPFVDGKLGKAAGFDGHRYVNGGKVLSFNYLDPVTFAAWIYPTAADGAILSSVEDLYQGSGYGLYLRDGKLTYHFTMRWTDLGMRLETQQPLALNQWHHVAFTYDGRRKPSGARFYVDGVPQETKVLFNEMSWPLGDPQPLRIGAGEGPEDRFQGAIEDVRVYNRALSPEEAGVLPVLESASEIAAISPTKRTPAQASKLAFCFLDQYAPVAVQESRLQVAEAQHDRDQYYASIPTVMVMKEGPPRDAYILKRGAYDARGDKVSAGLPHVLSSMPASFPNNRLGLAEWLVDRSNPLTARVTVNRFWQMLFGTGLVKTVDDFGSQGEWPVYQDVLDSLAVGFMDSGWDVKALLKTMVMSATYRQSSKVTPALLEKDPENRLLARGPRFRLPPQAIRDQALAVSALLVEKVGGPPVKPYQPPGLWEEVSFGEGYKPDTGDALYRRSLYTFWKRTVAPPTMVTFDAATRETCMVRANRTNTPLQALNLMNDVTYIEASRKFAERMMKDGGATPADRINFAFRLVLARPPKPQEQAVLLDTLSQFKARYQAKPGAAAKYLSQGDSPRDPKLDPADLAAYTAIASLILNLDETITKE